MCSMKENYKWLSKAFCSIIKQSLCCVSFYLFGRQRSLKRDRQLISICWHILQMPATRTLNQAEACNETFSSYLHVGGGGTTICGDNSTTTQDVLKDVEMEAEHPIWAAVIAGEISCCTKHVFWIILNFFMFILGVY